MEEQASKLSLPTPPLPTLVIAGAWSWDKVLSGAERSAFEAVLAETIPARRWFGSKSRAIRSLQILDAVAVTDRACLLLASVRFAAARDEVYHVPLAFRPIESMGDQTGDKAGGDGVAPWIRVTSASGEGLGIVYDALADEPFCQRLLELFESPGELPAAGGAVLVERTEAFDSARGDRRERLAARLLRAEQSNSSIVFGRRLIMKIFRRVETGLNPDFEVSDFLTRQGFANTPALAGSLVYQAKHEEPWALAMLQAFVPNRGDAWQFTLDWLAAALGSFGQDGMGVVPLEPEHGLLQAAELPIPPAVRSVFDEFLSSVELLARRTAELHLALASDASEPDFAPEPFTDEDGQEFFGRASEQAAETFDLLRGHLPRLTGDVAEQAQRVVGASGVALAQLARLATAHAPVDKIRIHGDYHLGQVLATGDDFMIIDFEGEPVRSIHQRRQKQLALRDVAGMVRSLHYASRAAAAAARQQDGDGKLIDAWTRAWYAWSAAAFLGAYRRTAGKASFLPDVVRRFRASAQRLPIGKGDLRAPLRAQQPPRLGLPAAGGAGGFAQGSVSRMPVADLLN